MQDALKAWHNAGMAGLVQIRDVPEKTRRIMKGRAAARGQSLNAYLLDVINREAARPTVEEVLDRAASRAERSSASATELLSTAREEREQDLTAG